MKYREIKRVSLKQLLAIFITSIVLTGTAVAEKIGYVDARQLIDDSPQGKQQLVELEGNFSERNRELKGKFELFKSREAELQKNAVLMSAEEAEDKTDELRDLQRELKRDQRDYNEEYNAARNKSLAELQKVISEAVIFIAKRDKYDLIVQQAVYASDSVNLTKTVLEELVKRSKQ
ncbi:MAG: OmpH family outer membrane protein [bacterium]